MVDGDGEGGVDIWVDVYKVFTSTIRHLYSVKFARAGVRIVKKKKTPNPLEQPVTKFKLAILVGYLPHHHRCRCDLLFRVCHFSTFCTTDRGRSLAVSSSLALMRELERELAPACLRLYFNPDDQGTRAHLRQGRCTHTHTKNNNK